MSSNFYDKEILTASFNELKKLLKFLEELGTPHPTITGGWAVYAYEKSMGSRDIDIVMVSEADVLQHLYNDYFPKYNFQVKKIGFFPTNWEKIVQTPDGPKDIIVDIFHGGQNWKDEGNLGINFSWKWTLDFQEELDIDGLKIFVPKRELLLITKMMAAEARSRQYDLTGHYRLPPKISKDYKDVARLILGNSIDFEFYKEYMKKSDAIKHLSTFLARYKQDVHVATLDDMNSNYDEIESILKI